MHYSSQSFYTTYQSLDSCSDAVGDDAQTMYYDIGIQGY